MSRPRTPKDLAEQQALQRIATLAHQIMITLRQPQRGVYESERMLRQWLSDEEVQFANNDLANALDLLESVGWIQRAKVKANKVTSWLARHKRS